LADGFAAKDASGATVEILTDEVTDGTLGTGQKQLVGIVDATINGTNKLVVDSSGRAKVDASGVPVPVTDNGTTLSVDDGAGSLTVDGTVAVSGVSGVVHVDDNSASLTVDDGGGSLTVDGTVGVSGTVTVDSELTTADLDTGAGTDTKAVVGLALANSGGALLVGSANPVPVSDNGGSITVDGSVNVGSLPSIPAGTNNIGDVDVVSMPAASVSTDSIASAPLAETSTAGATPFKLISAATTNATSVKGSVGKVFYIAAFNLNASPRYLKIYDKASAPTVGTDTPKHVFLIPGNTAGAGFTLNLGMPAKFASGIAFALTTGITDADTGAVAANEIVVNLGYV
jgi:hypothetical protein